MALTTEQQSYVILKTIESKLVSANKIDPETAGTGVLRMKRGAKVSANIIERRYQNLVKQVGQDRIVELFQSYPGEQKSIAKESTKEMEQKARSVERTSKTELVALQAELEATQARIAELETENIALKGKLAKLPKEPIKIEGWSIVQRQAGGGEHRYWYAGKSIGGKMQWIYLGKELDLKAAREKIKAEQGKKR